jgi:hypothetical protein
MDSTLARFLGELEQLTASDLRRIADSLESEALTDEVDWWRATIAIDKVLRHTHCTRQAGRAASDAVHAVEDAAQRAGIETHEPMVARVARAAADVARGLAAGPPARPVVRLLLEHWEPVTADA